VNKLLLAYLPYGVIDLFLTLAIISEIVNQRYDLLWSNLPIFIWGIISLNQKIKAEANDSGD